jgi:hypothetical protein
MTRHWKEAFDIAGAERWTVSHGASPRQRYLNIESLSRQTHPSRRSSTKLSRRKRGVSKSSRKHSAPKNLASTQEWPAFVDTYRTLLADPPPELMRLFERLSEITEAA